MARKTFTSTAVKQRWNARHYDRIVLLFKKGDKEKVMDYAKRHGMSMNGYINKTAREILGVSEEEWKPEVE